VYRRLAKMHRLRFRRSTPVARALGLDLFPIRIGAGPLGPGLPYSSQRHRFESRTTAGREIPPRHDRDRFRALSFAAGAASLI
jgi:hypothetical protein